MAANDGYLLRWFLPKGVPVLGVEPAANVAEAGRKLGIPMEVMFFGRESARKLRDMGHAADLMAANNVVAHVPDLNDFIAGFAILLKEHGVATFEFHHVLNLLQKNQFDNIYHEHFCYHGFLTFSRILAHHGLAVFDRGRDSQPRGLAACLLPAGCHRQTARQPARGRNASP